ncbi:hypothetical protein D3C80_1562080 [compost metagenome]
MFTRIWNLLSDLSASFEAVDHEDADEGSSNKRTEVGAVVCRTHGVEKNAERILAFKNEKVQAHPDHTDKFSSQSCASNPSKRFGAS